MFKFARRCVSCVLLVFGVQIASADLSFVAVQQVDDGWDFGLFAEANDLKPEASANANITSGLEMFWALTYDGSGLMTYSWGTSANALSTSIQYNLGPQDFDYLYVSTYTKPNSKPTAVVQDLVLQADAGILKAESIESGSGNDNSHLFAFNDLAAFGTWTLSGSTTFTWNGKGSNSDDLAVFIAGGYSSAVVGEPMSAAIFMIGIVALALRSLRRKGNGPVPAAA